MIETRIIFTISFFCSALLTHAQASLSGHWMAGDGSCTYEVRVFEDGQLEARVSTTTRANDRTGRIVLDHIEGGGDGRNYKAVIHSSGVDVPREVRLFLRGDGGTLELDIPRPISSVHILWHRVKEGGVVGAGSSLISLNE